MDRDPDPETKRRMVHAAHLLETGRTFGEFKKFGPITLAEMKYRYVAHVVEQEETFRAAGRLLDIDPATACRIFNSGRDGDKSMFETIPVDRLSPKPNNGTG